MIWSDGEWLLNGEAAQLRKAGVRLAVDNPLWEVAEVLGPRAAKAIGMALIDVVASLGTGALATIGTSGQLGTGGWWPSWRPGPIGFRPLAHNEALTIWHEDGHRILFQGEAGDLKVKKVGRIASMSGGRWLRWPGKDPREV